MSPGPTTRCGRGCEPATPCTKNGCRTSPRTTAPRASASASPCRASPGSAWPPGSDRPARTRRAPMRHPPHLRYAAAFAALATALATALSACGSGSPASSAGSTLTIQGENFSPLVASSELHGTYLIYAPLELASPIDGSYTPFLATGYQFTSPTTFVYTIRQGVKWSDGKPFTPADV